MALYGHYLLCDCLYGLLPFAYTCAIKEQRTSADFKASVALEAMRERQPSDSNSHDTFDRC